MGGLFRQYSWIADLAGVLLCSFFLAKIAGIYLGGMLEVKRSIGVLKTAEVAPHEKKTVEVAEYNIILERNIFDSAEAGSPKPPCEGDDCKEPVDPNIATGEAVKTSLSLKVLGVLVVGEGRDKRSTATISGGGGTASPKSKDSKGGGGGGSEKVYAVGDEESFAPNTKLTRVQPDRIEFINSGRLEYAEVATVFGEDIFGPPKQEPVASNAPEPKAQREPAVQKGDPGKFSVDQREIDDAMQNLDKLYTDIRAVPNFAGGKVAGMKILSVKSDSLFAKLGLRRGDILQKINGVELDVKRGFEIFNQLKDQKSISLDLVRQGAPTTLEYEIR